MNYPGTQLSYEEYAAHVWQIVVADLGDATRADPPVCLDARLDDWEVSLAEDGQPMLRARVYGADGARVLRAFGTGDSLTLPREGVNQRPAFDYSVPDVVACVWQSAGVWIEFWHPDVPALAPSPAPVTAPAPSRPAIRRALSGPGGRLRFTRRNKTPKETPAA